MAIPNPTLEDHLRRVLPKLLGPRRRLLVAVSGGPDSQALLDGLARLRPALGLTLWAMGVDHGLRPAARAELEQARQLAQAWQVPFATARVQVAGPGNLLARCRLARYNALRRAARKLGAEGVALAHTADDQAETVLFHLARGAGLRGAAGMAPRRGLLVRPLLALGRDGVMAHLVGHAIPYATDPSNAAPARMRAQLRATVVPALRGLNGAATAHLAAFAAVARAEDALLDRLAARRLRRAVTPDGALLLAALRRCPEALTPRVLRLWLAPYGARPSAAQLHRLLAALPPGAAPLAQGALGPVVVYARGDRFVATPSLALPPRRAGT